MVLNGLLLAYALILSYIESLIPFAVGIPGIKLGLANLAVVLCLYKKGRRDALLLNICRILLAGFLFGNLYSILYSLAGGFLSFVVMCVAQRGKNFGILGVSVLGGVFHNLGQIGIAVFVTQTPGILYYIPWLVVAGVLTGTGIGILAQILLPRLEGKERIKE